MGKKKNDEKDELLGVQNFFCRSVLPDFERVDESLNICNALLFLAGIL